MKKEPEPWKDSIRNSVKNIQELSNEIELNNDEKIEITKKLPLRITPYYLDIIKTHPVLRRTVVPTINEFVASEDETMDPLDESKYSKTKCIVHKYPDRALFIVTNFCSVNCRYCTRSRIFDNIENQTTFISNNDLEESFQYIREHKEIRDIIISGGDPLTLGDDKLEYIIKNIRDIEHVEIIRIGTKIPVVLPQRITDNLVDMLKKYHPLYMSIHFTHPDEITKECSDALNKIANAGIVMRSQTVLLKGINGDVETMKKLMHKLLINRVSPYYIYNCDKIIGSSHFRTSIEKGIEIIKGLRGYTSGYAIPQFIVDTEYGKIAVNPDNVIVENNKIVGLKSYTGKVVDTD